jgi:hypothetical protein
MVREDYRRHESTGKIYPNIPLFQGLISGKGFPWGESKPGSPGQDSLPNDDAI